jgi:hypothetical protein
MILKDRNYSKTKPNVSGVKTILVSVLLLIRKK